MSENAGPDAFCFAMPVLPGKTAELRDLWKEIAARWHGEVQQHIGEARVRQLVACLQHTPLGDLHVQFVDAQGGIQAWLARAAAVDTDYTRWMERTIRDISGIDWTNPANAPALEPLADWRAADAASGPVEQEVFAQPILPGQTAALRAYWAAHGGARAAEVAEHAGRVGLVRVVAYRQATPQGDLLVQYLATREGVTSLLEQASASEFPIGRWIQEQYRGFSGIDAAWLASERGVEMLFQWPVT